MNIWFNKDEMNVKNIEIIKGEGDMLLDYEITELNWKA